MSKGEPGLEERVKRAARAVCGSEPGRLLVAWLAAKYHLGTPAHVAGDPCQTAFNDGGRAVILEILDLAGQKDMGGLLQWLRKEPVAAAEQGPETAAAREPGPGRWARVKAGLKGLLAGR